MRQCDMMEYLAEGTWAEVEDPRLDDWGSGRDVINLRSKAQMLDDETWSL